MVIQQQACSTVTPTQAERNEWSRMAQDAYRVGRNFYGHRYSAWAARSGPITTAVYDALQINYRLWLTQGWKPFAV